MMAAVETPCVWIITVGSIFGITVEKLMRLGKDAHKIQWNSLPYVPSLFDFSLDDLPDLVLIPLLYDSNIFLASYSGDIYHLQFHDTTNKEKQLLLRLSKVPPESIPSPPVTINEFCKPLFANIGGKLYFLAFDSAKWMRQEPLPEGFWVLDPAIGDWRSLDFPIPIGDKNYDSDPYFFTLHNKIFFEPRFVPKQQYHNFCFDCQTEKWKNFGPDSEEVLDIPPVPCRLISLALPRHLMVAVMSRMDYGGCEEHKRRVVKLYAVLLDTSKDYSILFHQQLDELYEGLEEDLCLEGDLKVEILDLGHGLVCALVFGDRFDHGRSYLCVIVFSLSWRTTTTPMIPLLDDDEKEGKPGKILEGKPGKFLDVELYSNRLLFFPPDPDNGCYSLLHHAFITNYTTSYGYNKGTTSSSPPRKQLKLDSD